VSQYRYAATDVLTGALLWDDIPLKVTSASRTINGVGQLSGSLDLQANTALTRTYMRALTPRKSFLWMLQDGWPIWVGRVLDTPVTSIRNHQLPITAKTPEQIFSKRLITGALAFTNADLFDMARALINYGTSAQLGPNAQIAQMALSSGLAGATDTWTFGTSNTVTVGADTYYGAYSDNQDILDALTTLATSDNFEFTVEPTMSGMGQYSMTWRFGYPTLGQPLGTTTQVLKLPGEVLDYGRAIMGSNAANWVIATATANGTGDPFVSASPHGVDTADLAAGFPLEQVAISWPGAGVTSQAQINAYADEQLGVYTAGTMLPNLVLGGGQNPPVREIGLGDAVYLAASSELDPEDPDDGSPGLQLAARIVGWSVQPPNEDQDEEITITAGQLTGQISTGTVS